MRDSINSRCESQCPEKVAPSQDDAKPDLPTIKTIHRADDGYVTLHNVNVHSGRWSDLGGILTSELLANRTDLANALCHNSFFSINTFFRPSRSVRRLADGGPMPLSCPLTGLPIVSRKANNVRWLNA